MVDELPGESMPDGIDVDDGDVDFIKLPREHNVADYFTRPVTHQEYLHYEQYMWPQLHMAQWTAM